MLPKYRRYFALLLAAVNIACKDVIDNYDIILVKGLLHQYVKDWQKIFDLRHISSDIHSLLHIHESIQYLGPLYMYSTFNFKSFDHGMVCMIHGMTHYGPQLISNLQYYRQAIIDVFKRDYPEKLFYFNEIIKHIKYKTLSSIKSRKFADCRVSFVFGRQTKLGLIRAIVTDPNDSGKIFILLEDLIDEFVRHHLLQFKTNNTTFSTIPNIYIRKRSSCLILRSSSHILHKHSYRFLNDEETIEIIEYSSLKESS
ncbi:unnamed protein product [Rotaria sordida]|uniref:Uncharacterized protein n=1 Tax=Rotaria sordida TaxID=392033 RepID=A0A815TTY4_9BILA|nr:unnamed protein product [Rotaria sordida]CAF1507276.1 unnamed protein product [Rotaria sordida]CAF1507468.1 unnamed protein product [Rotaria sordida]